MGFELEKEQSYTRFWLLLFMLLAMVGMRYGLQIGIPRMVFLVLIAIIVLKGNQTEIITICICLIPLYESLDFYYAILICVAVYAYKYFWQININYSMVLVLIMVVWELFHGFAEKFSPVLFVTSFVPLFALSLIMCSDISELDYDLMIRAFAVTTVAISVIMMIQIVWISGFNIGTALINLRRLGVLDEASQKALMISGGTVQTNSLGIICVLVVTGLLQLRFVGRNKKIDNYLMFILLGFGALTASRTFLACLLLMLVLTMMGQEGGWRKLRFLALMVLGGSLFVVVFWLIFPTQIEFFVSRFFEKDITTGRDDLMVIYNNFIVNNPKVMWFGLGVQGLGDRLINTYHVARNAPHNSIQEIILAWGIPGVVMMFMLLGTLLRHTGSRRIINYIPLIIILFKSMAGQLLTSGYSMLALSYAYLSLAQNFEVSNLEPNT